MAVATALGRGAMALELDSARRESARLFSILKPEHLYERPIAERHRTIFYTGHLDAFDYIQICREGLGLKSRHPELDVLFQAGIDPDSNHLPADTAADWPSLDVVKHYVADARAAVDQALEVAPPDVVAMALEHRLMHLETLAYMFHNFDHHAKREGAVREREERNHDTGRPNEWLSIPGGTALLGKPLDGRFGWDNEYLEHQVPVAPFRIQKFKVTNGDYLRFVREGGPMPHFWTERNGQLHFRGMFAEIPLPLDWPVYVTQKQAAAYAAWLGKALPTEAQFHHAAFSQPGGGTRSYPWGEAAPARVHGNFDFSTWNPESVYASPAGESALGVRQLVGNGWEWTASVFAPFQGFEPAPSYPGYSANFFDGEHYVLKGASCRTAARLLRRSFRNWFRPEYPYVYATFRCVEN